MALSFSFSLSSYADNEIGFEERFALAEDREAVLKELIPGTEEFYHYSVLHAQNEGQLDKAAKLLAQWEKQLSLTPQCRQAFHRQALLRYATAPEDTISYLEKELRVSFRHSKERLTDKPDLPTQLDPEKISREAFLKAAASGTGERDLQNFTPLGLDHLFREGAKLSQKELREVLNHLGLPDYENLVPLIAEDLNATDSGGFGSIPVHQLLTLDQLRELEKLQPALTKDWNFVQQILNQLHPSDDELLHRNPAARQAWNDRVYEYVKGLPPVFSSLQTAVLYQRLQLARARGEFLKEEFMEYLRLPRAVPYMLREYISEQSHNYAKINLSEDFSATIGLPPIVNDEPLVREYLEHLFIDAESTTPWEPYLQKGWLQRVFAETKLLYGQGKAEDWLPKLSPSQVRDLQRRIELNFSASNSEHFSAADEVTLDVHLKNIPELIVRVYEINALNYYRDTKKEIDTDIDLDGLTANEEKTYQYKETPLLRHTETFSFDSLKGKKGIWVIEWIGNGISSRALVRKGRLQALTQTTVGGAQIAVIDEDNQSVKKASAWLGGKRYAADDDGRILLPFAQAGNVPVILSDGPLASLVKITMPQEEYELSSGFFLEQETLLPGTIASVTLRPKLTLQGVPVSLTRLENVKVSISTLDWNLVGSVNRKENVELSDSEDTSISFRVPARLQTVQVSLSADLKPISGNRETQQLVAEHDFSVNTRELHDEYHDAYLCRQEDGYSLYLLGRTGEALPNRSIEVKAIHREFTKSVSASLQSDDTGRIQLGDLSEIASISCHFPGGAHRAWQLDQDEIQRPSAIHGKAGEVLEIPMPQSNLSGREAVALFEMRSDAIRKDLFSKIKEAPGHLSIEGLEPGNYTLVLKQEQQVLPLRIVASETSDFGYLLGQDRHLHASKAKALYLGDVENKDGALIIPVGNSDATTRIHLVATRFQPSFDLFSHLHVSDNDPLPEIRRGSNPTRFVSGRNIGEEYRYILERRTAKKYPGNLLTRPSLLLSPWVTSETQTDVKTAAEGEAYRQSPLPAPAQAGAAMGADGEPRTVSDSDSAETDTPSLQFFAHQAITLMNLRVAKDGTVTIPLDQLGDRQYVHLLAVGPGETVSRSLAVPEPKGGAAIRDLRLAETLDPKKHFTQKRKVTLLQKGQGLTVPNFRSNKVQPYGTIDEVYRILLATMQRGTTEVTESETLQKFAFVTKWPQLDEKQKQDLYSEHACHELNFFLSQKDAEFFKAVVQPYLKNKKDKTFLDHYLLEDALDRYLQPWEFHQLNLFERILLSRRMGDDEHERTARYVTRSFQLLPPDPESDLQYYRRALLGLSSDADSDFPEDAQMDAVGLSMRGRAFSDTSSSELKRMAASAPRENAPDAPTTRLGVAVSAAPAAPTESEMDSLRKDARVADKTKALLEKGQERALYVPLDSTKEYAENNYYHLPISEHQGELIQVNRFWLDFAKWDGKGGFYSREFPSASRQFTDAMLALAVLDLPFEAEDAEVKVENDTYQLLAQSPTIVFHEEIEATDLESEKAPVLVSQNFLQKDNRQREVNGEMVDNFITGDFIAGVVYSTHVVVTNPTTTARRLEVLIQIPQGAVPLAKSDALSSLPVRLGALSSRQIEVSFYFPSPSGAEGFAMYPVQVSQDEKVIASTEPRSLRVLAVAEEMDKDSWDYISQLASKDQVLAYLESHNPLRLDLSRIAWRVKEDAKFYQDVTDLLGANHIFDPILWSYSLYHKDTAKIREYLKHQTDFLNNCGLVLDSELVTIDPVERSRYQYLEYAPLVNARTHRLGQENTILNDRFAAQYKRFLDVLSYRPTLSADDTLNVTAYLALQDRIEEAMVWLDRVAVEELSTQVQYDYLRVYFDFYRGEAEAAKTVAANYLQYPVTRWRKLFAEVVKQADQSLSAEAKTDDGADPKDRERRLETMASREPFVELTAKGSELTLRHGNVPHVTVQYYEMDLELLFSRQPFVSAGQGSFAYIRPNRVETQKMSEDGKNFVFQVPEAFANKNVLIEVIGGGKSSRVAVYANKLDLRVSESSGRLELTREDNGKPVSQAYVKVYAKMKDGSVHFYKDGYTDLRGVFDYTSLSTDEISQVAKLSLLVVSEELGSVVREVAPPIH